MIPHEIVEVLLRRTRRAQPQDVGRRHIRIERDVIFCHAKENSRRSKDRAPDTRHRAGALSVDFTPPDCHMVRIQIHHDGDHVAEILVCFV